MSTFQLGPPSLPGRGGDNGSLPSRPRRPFLLRAEGICMLGVALLVALLATAAVALRWAPL